MPSSGGGSGARAASFTLGATLRRAPRALELANASPRHVRLAGRVGPARIFGVGQPGFGFAGFALELGEEPCLAAAALAAGSSFAHRA